MNVKTIVKTLGLSGYAVFCLLWIFFLTIHHYEWMLDEPGSEFHTLCELPPHKLTFGELCLFTCFCLAPLVLACGLEWRKCGKPGVCLFVVGGLLVFALFRLLRFLC
jgi:hypothetical protein